MMPNMEGSKKSSPEVTDLHFCQNLFSKSIMCFCVCWHIQSVLYYKLLAVLVMLGGGVKALYTLGFSLSIALWHSSGQAEQTLFIKYVEVQKHCMVGQWDMKQSCANALK